MEQCRPERYLGPCQVIRISPAPHAINTSFNNRRQAVLGRNRRILPEDLQVPLRAERVLFATGTYPDPTVFNEDFAALSPELIHRLHAEGVGLVGIDTPSIDLFQSKDLPAHGACLEHDIRILEGLTLAGIPEGIHELIALPLRLAGFDASPVRAVPRTY
uniref:Cyclase n=1 Tax=Candidatus Kentrum eta TaxID=2126337 RepID=A0A450VE88_9GAMM|nr:MAG: Putative cyclase [Candidatus Kentron sp. H]VFJ97990.1 MAG: Putative cyclase [Candidatus Kentron sp. H]VFK03129.1 MAG: Putative cyclase [Candidatus Kentron sp. H]